ncbi:MAG: chitobiase/beta-hexosaminidase C-terminal domain-containing protein [Leptospiraceae bacterium]|nr:chitobiase/beta-hexosaminidase C-terminal domain-containing protein [Leptospiraceae bacterium]
MALKRRQIQNTERALKAGQAVELRTYKNAATGTLTVPLSDSNADGKADGLDLDGDGTLDLRFLSNGSAKHHDAESFSYPVDIDNDGIVDYYLQARLTGSVIHLELATAEAKTSIRLVFHIDTNNAVTGISNDGNNSATEDNRANGKNITNTGGSNSTDTTAPSQVTGVLATTGGSDQINISWNTATDETSQASALTYQICQSTTSGGCNTFTATFTTTAGANSYAVTGLNPVTTYYFTVRALDAALNAGIASTEVNSITANAGTVATPTFSPVAGTYGASQNVDINSTTSGSTICYTNDSSDPACDANANCTTGSNYSTAISVSSTTTLKAIACLMSFTNSGIASGNFTIDTTSPSTPAGFTSTAAGATQIDLSWSQSTDSVTPQNQIVYEICQGTTTGACNTFVTTYTTNAGASSYSVTGLSALQAYYFRVRARDAVGNHSTATGEQNATTMSTGTVNAPQFSPAAGTYSSSQNVGITTVTSGATLCYTNDGSTPSCNVGGSCNVGNTYSTSLTVSASQTLRAIGCRSGYTASNVTVAIYTINATIAGTLYYPAAQSNKTLKVFLDTDSNPFNGFAHEYTGTTNNQMTQSYSFTTDLASGTYYLLSWVDVDGNTILSNGDYYAWHATGSDEPSAADFTLSPGNSYTLPMALSKHAGALGTVANLSIALPAVSNDQKLYAFLDSDQNIGNGWEAISAVTTNGNTNYNLSFENTPAGSYHTIVMLDGDSNFTKSSGDQFAFKGGTSLNPIPIASNITAYTTTGATAVTITSDTFSTASAYSVNGTITLNAAEPSKTCYVFLDKDNNLSNGFADATVSSCGSNSTVNFTLANVPTGNFYLVAHVDNNDGMINTGDYYGYHSSGSAIAPGSTTISVSSANVTGANFSPNYNAPTNWAFEAYLKAPNNSNDDRFGYGVSIDGDTAIVGAYQEDSTTTSIINGSNLSATNDSGNSNGAAYVFKRNGTNWNHEAYLKAPNNSNGDRFGYSLSISGDTAVVGAYVEYSNTTSIINSSNLLATNDSGNGNGAAYVFRRNATTWTHEAYLKAPNNSNLDIFGGSVSISGETAIVGARQEDSSTTTIINGSNLSTINDSGNFNGAAYVFKRNGTTWTHEAYLKAPNNSNGDSFGISVALDGDTAVVGANYEDSTTTSIINSSNLSSTNDSGVENGAAYVFKRNGTNWTHEAYLKAPNTSSGDNFGISVALDGGTAIVGAVTEGSTTTSIINDTDLSATNDLGTNNGAVYVFRRQ